MERKSMPRSCCVLIRAFERTNREETTLTMRQTNTFMALGMALDGRNVTRVSVL